MGQIAYVSLRMRKTALFLFPVKNLTLPSCSPTPISYKMQEFCRLGHKFGPNCIFLLRMRKTALFLLPVKNLTSPSCSPTPISYATRELWRYLNILGRYCVFHTCMDFQDLRVKNGGRPPTWISFPHARDNLRCSIGAPKKP